MKIGNAVQTLQRSEQERERILKSLEKGAGKPNEVFNSYASSIRDRAVWVRAHKRLHINGFRPGKGNDVVITRVLNGLQNNDKHVEPIFWDLYLGSIIEYMRHESTSLNDLLLEQDFEGETESTDSIIAEIVKHSIAYDVDIAQIEDLYELWWFDRTENLHNLFEAQEINILIVKDLISKSSKKQSREVEKLKNRVNNLEINECKSTQNKKFEFNLETLRTELDDLKNQVGLDLLKIERKYASRVGDKLSELEQKIEADVELSNEEVDKDLANKVCRNEQNINELNLKIEQLEKLGYERRSARSRSKFEFQNKDFIKHGLNSVANEYEADDYLSELLKHILNYFNCFYIESTQLFEALAGEVLKEGRVRDIIATPAMIDIPMDVLAELELLDVIYLQNISSCFVEGFVLPLLMKSGSPIRAGFPKIFVLEDNDLNPTALSRVLRHSIYISADWIHALSVSLNQGEFENFDEKRLHDVSSYHREFQRVFQNSGFRIDHYTFQNFVKLTHILEPFLGEERSIHLAAEASVYEYARNCFGNTKTQMVIDLVRDTSM